MNSSTLQTIELWPLGIYFLAIIALVAIILGVSSLLGERHRERATGEPFESGVMPVGYARFRLSAQFYRVAVFFVIFDLEAVFIFAWAVAFRETGWAGFIEVAIFIAILLAALVYLWRSGALDWGPRQHPSRPQQRGDQ